MKDEYQYKIIASGKAIRHIRANDLTIEELFPEKKIDEWSLPTTREIETEIEDLLWSRPEHTVEIHFRNTVCDEQGVIIIKDGKRAWKE